MKMKKRILSFVLSIGLLAGIMQVAATQSSESIKDERAGLHMAYLGTGDKPATEAQPLPDTTNWVEGTEFWLGIYADNLTNIDKIPNGSLGSHIIMSKGDNISGGIYNTAVGLQYASLYIEPVGLESGDAGYTGNEEDDQKNFLKNALCEMPKWSSQGSYYSVAAASYNEPQFSITGSDTAEVAQEDKPKMVYLNMKSQAPTQCIYFSSLDNEPLYLMVVKFRIVAMPNENIKLFSLVLDPVHTVLQTGDSGRRWSAQWNADRQITPDGNLKNHFDYEGDISFDFSQIRVNELKSGKYLETYNVRASFGGKALVGELPPGLSYTPGIDTITGTPTLAGKYVFRIGTKYYSINIQKIPLNVKVSDADKNKVYGEPIPEFHLQYSGFINGENENTASFKNSLVPPIIACEADEHTPVGEVPIALSDGSSDNYEFIYEESTLKITPRELKITSINSIPRIPQNSPLSFSAMADESQISAEGLVSGDHLTLSFDVTYPESITEGYKTVKIENVAIMDKNDGANYTLVSAPASAQGLVDNRGIANIEITTQPKLSYIYGEPLDLSELRATITYSGGEPPEYELTYGDLLERQIGFMYNGKSGQSQAAQSDILDVDEYNNAEILLYSAGRSLGRTDKLSLSKRDLEFSVSAKSKEYDGSLNTEGTIRLLNALEKDDVRATADFRFTDPNASSQLKEVEVSNISLLGADCENYSIEEQAKTQAQIVWAHRTEKVEAPTLELNRETNEIVVTAPLSSGDITYGYSLGNGVWQTSPIFSELVQGREYSVQARILSSQNYTASDPSKASVVKTGKNKITVMHATKDELVAIVYTDLEVAESAQDITDALVEGHSYVGYWLDKELEVELEYPYTIQKDNVFYVKNRPSNNRDWSISPSEIYGLVGDEPIKINIKGKDNREASNVYWRSTNEAVAKVDKNGNVTLVGEGTANIIARRIGEDIATIPVTVVKSYTSRVDMNFTQPYISGYEDGSFRPDMPITRAEMATILDNILIGEMDQELTLFSDVSGDEWYGGAVKRLTGMKLLSGYEDGRFRPSGNLTRGEAAKLICIAAGLKIGGEEPETVYSDCEEHWAKLYIYSVTKAGLMNGYPDGSFMPNSPATRAEIVSVVNRMLGAGELENTGDATVPNDVSEEHWAYTDIVKAMNKRKINN